MCSCCRSVMCSNNKKEEKANKTEANTIATDENYDEGQNMVLSSEKNHCNQQPKCQPKIPQQQKNKKTVIIK